MQDKIQDKELKRDFNLKLWVQMLKYSIPFRKLMIYLGVLMIVVAGIDSIIPLFMRYAIDNFIIPREYQGLFWFSVLYIGLVFFQSANTWLLIAIAGKVETGINFDLRRLCYQRLQEMEFAYYDRTPTGWLVARTTSDISKLGDIVAWGIVDLVWGLALMLGIIIIMFILNWKLALLALALIPFLVFISTRFHITILRNYRLVRRFNSQITNSFGECIHGAKTTKTLVREEANLSEFQELNRKMFRHSVSAAIKSALFMPIILVTSTIGTGLILWFGGNLVVLEAIGYGTLVAFISYTLQLFDPISHVASLFAELQNAQAAAERVFSLLQLKPGIENLIAYDDNWRRKRMRGEIELENISFSYCKGKPVLTDFSLNIRAGESIALVGETGTGKTTIVNLICRFYEPLTGRILIDGHDYRNVPISWIHSHLGYVQQTPHLFQGSIRENIRYGKLDSTDYEVEQAARNVNAHDFIERLTDQYDYKVGEAGNLLSTGQKQLISFARVVLANPAILILDEATASIDTETELLVQMAIARILQQRTSIIIAHRLSTIRNVDRIIYLEKGKIVEEGCHKELMRRKGRYYQLYLNQFMQEEGDRILASHD